MSGLNGVALCRHLNVVLRHESPVAVGVHAHVPTLLGALVQQHRDRLVLRHAQLVRVLRED